MLPTNYKVLPNNTKKTFPGQISGSGQPGFEYRKDFDLDILKALKEGKSPDEAGVDRGLLSQLDSLYQAEIRTIYSLAHYPSDRHPELLKFLWQQKADARYITEIDGVNLEINDFEAPTQEQLKVISQDATKRMEGDEHILVHCGAGIGRTGTVLAAIEMFAHEQYNVTQAIENIRKDYKFNAVEGETQKNALKKFSDSIQILKIDEILTKSDATSQEKNNALVYAINLNLPDKISALLLDGAGIKEALSQVNQKGKENSLKFALNNHNFQMALDCINAGANINTQDEHKNSILSLAITNNDDGIINYLCSNKYINLDLKDASGKTPLIHALDSNNDQLIKKLIFSGATLKDISNQAISTAKLTNYWKEALETGNFKTVKNLAEYYPTLIQEKIDDLVPLRYALKMEQKSLYIQMVALGLNLKPNALNIAKTMLNEDPKLIEGVLSHGISIVPFFDSNGKLPKACEEYLSFDKNKIKQLLQAAIDDNDITLSCSLIKLNPSSVEFLDNGESSISYALSEHKNNLAIEMAKVGLKSAVYSDINPINNALKLSIDLDEEKFVKTYITEGAEVRSDRFGTKCLVSAIKKQNIEIVKMLIDAGAPINKKDPISQQTPLMCAVEADNSAILNFIVTSPNIDLDAADANNKTALMYAVKDVSPSSIATLIEAGADVNLVVNDSTALMEAVILNKPAILEILINKYRVNPDIKDNVSKTALMKTTDPNIAKILIKHGANLNEVDNGDKAAMEYLVENCGETIVEAVKEAAQDTGDTYISDQTEEAIFKYMQKNIVKKAEKELTTIKTSIRQNDLNLLREGLQNLIDLNNQDYLELATTLIEMSGKDNLIELVAEMIPVTDDITTIEGSTPLIRSNSHSLDSIDSSYREASFLDDETANPFSLSPEIEREAIILAKTSGLEIDTNEKLISKTINNASSQKFRT